MILQKIYTPSVCIYVHRAQRQLNVTSYLVLSNHKACISSTLHPNQTTLVNHINNSEKVMALQRKRVLTKPVPRKKETRFLLTGKRISRQLKLRQVAEALAQASVDYRERQKQCTREKKKNTKQSQAPKQSYFDLLYASELCIQY